MPTAYTGVEVEIDVNLEYRKKEEEYKQGVCHLRFANFVGNDVIEEPYTLCLYNTERALVINRPHELSDYEDALRPICMCGKDRCKRCLAILMQMFNSDMNDLHRR